MTMSDVNTHTQQARGELVWVPQSLDEPSAGGTWQAWTMYNQVQSNATAGIRSTTMLTVLIFTAVSAGSDQV